MAPIDSLVGWLQAQEATRFPVVLTELLRWGARSHDATEAAFRERSFDGARTELGAALSGILPKTPTDFLERAQLLELARWLTRVDREQCALAVRLAAKQFDTSGWLKCYLQRVGDEPKLAGPHDLVPRLSAFGVLKGIYGKTLATNPASLTSRAELSHFALLPATLPYGLHVRLHAGWDPLDEVDGDTSLQTLVPWCLSELQVVEQTPERYFGVAPKDVSSAGRPLACAEQVAANSVVLFPEVSVSDEVARDLAKLLSRKKVLLGVCGSAHAEADGVRTNVSRIVSRQHLEASQRKIVGMRLNGRIEDIETTQPTMEVFFGSTWSAVVLICRDFIDQGILELLRLLRPGLVLVPACSPSTADFENGAASLSSAQAHVLVANTCERGSDEDPAMSILSRPSTAPLEERLHTHRRSKANPPQGFAQSVRPRS